MGEIQSKQNQTMTIKQIAEICGFRSTKTLLKWIKNGQKLTDKDGQIMTVISQKLTIAQKTKKAAQFNLDEVIVIIKAGGNETLASLLRDNAESSTLANAQLENTTQINIEEAIERGIKAGLQAIIPLIEKISIQNQPKAIENKKTVKSEYEYFSLRQLGEKLIPKKTSYQVSRLLQQKGFAYYQNQVKKLFPSEKSLYLNFAIEMDGPFGKYIGWRKDLVGILQEEIKKEDALFYWDQIKNSISKTN